jgi:hypothetical protein
VPALVLVLEATASTAGETRSMMGILSAREFRRGSAE